MGHKGWLWLMVITHWGLSRDHVSPSNPHWPGLGSRLLEPEMMVELQSEGWLVPVSGRPCANSKELIWGGRVGSEYSDTLDQSPLSLILGASRIPASDPAHN